MLVVSTTSSGRMSSLHIPSEDELENCIFVLYIVNSNTKLLGVLDLLKLYSPPPCVGGVVIVQMQWEGWRMSQLMKHPFQNIHP